MTSVIFPGQGSQYVGMAKDFYENFNQSKLVFEEIENILSMNLKKIIFEDEGKKINITNITQICIFTSSLSIYKAFESEFDLSKINNMFGHSLGEYLSLTASNKISISDCVKLIQIRGNLMNSAVEPNLTGMAALIGKNCNYVEDIIKKNNLNLEIANDNSPIQVVISGSNKDINESENVIIKAGIKKIVKLNVSAAFHSSFMSEAENKLNQYINDIKLNSNKISIISNFDAHLTNENLKILNSLKKQMSNRVRWTETIQNLEKTGNKKIIEIGPGKVLSGLINRISSFFDIISINKVDDLKQLNNNV